MWVHFFRDKIQNVLFAVRVAQISVQSLLCAGCYQLYHTIPDVSFSPLHWRHFYVSNRLWQNYTVRICGNKLPTRYNRGFYYRSYCLLNMFRAPLCPSSGAQEYYTVVAACGISCCGFQVYGLVWRWWLCVQFAGWCSILQTGHITLSSTPGQQLENHSTKYHRQQPLYNTLELLMMDIVMPETCWASNKICNKNLCCT